MFKWVLIGLFVIGTVTTVPPIRNRVLPLFEPVIVKLGPVGHKIMSPARKWQAQTDTQNLMRELNQQRTQGRELPNVRTFSAWAQRSMRDDSAAFDPWGQRYFIKTGNRTMTIGSPGPDLKRDTPDDIIKTLTWN